MRIVVWSLVLAAVIGGFVALKQRREVTAAAQTASATPTPRPATSNYNLPKRALDRANEVKRQVAEERKPNDLP